MKVMVVSFVLLHSYPYVTQIFNQTAYC